MHKQRKILILALSDGGLEHHRDCESSKRTWASEINADIKVAFIRVGEGEKVIYQNKMLYLPKITQNFSIIEKTIFAMEWVLNNWEFDLLIRTNVSTYFDFTKLLSLTNRIPLGIPVLAGYPQSNKTFFANPVMFFSGAGMIFSHSAVKRMVQSNFKFEDTVPDDIQLSIAARELKFDFVYLPRNNLSDTHFFIPSAITRVKSSHDSYAASARYLLLYKYFQHKNKVGACTAYLQISKFELSSLVLGPKSFITWLRKIIYCFRAYVLILINSFFS